MSDLVDPIDPGGAPDYQSSLETARSAGYSWPEIQNHVAQGTLAAADVGYTQDEIDAHLGFAPPDRFELRARDSWAAQMAAEPTVLDALAPPNPSLDLSLNPNHRRAYADALLAGEVRSPRDFSLRYAAAALAAAHDVHELDASDPDAVAARQRAAGLAADGLAPFLPDREDLTDATLSVGSADARERLMANWADTGTHPIDAATNPDFLDRLTNFFRTPATGPEPPGVAEFNDLLKGFAEGVGLPADDLRKALNEAPGGEQFGAILGRLPIGMTVDMLRGFGETTRAAMAGEPISADEALQAAMAGMHISRIPGHPLEPRISMVDLSGRTNRPAISEVPISEAIAVPEPARMVPVETAAGAEGRSMAPQEIFAEGSTPAAKLERLAQLELENTGAAPNAMESGTFFQRRLAEAGDTDPASATLAQGADHTAGWGKWFGQTFSELLKDETGAMTLRTPEGRRQYILGKNRMDELIRRMSTGLETQKSENIARGFEPYFKEMSPFMPRWKELIAKGDVVGAMDSEIGRLVNALEGKGVLAQDSAMAPYARYRAEKYAEMKAGIDELVAAGHLNPVDWKEYYLHHNWTPESIGKAGGAEGLSGRTGNLSFTKERVHPTFEDGINAELKPLHENPIIIDINSLNTMAKVITATKMQVFAREQGWMKYFDDPRQAVREGYGKPLLGLNATKRISTVNADGTPGPVVTQQLYGQPGIDTIWNNWVGFDTLHRSETFASIEDAMLKMKNGSTYLKLLFPGFHTVTEFKNGMASGLANAAEEIGYAMRWNLPEGKPATLAGFTTSKGSTYQLHENGTTTRNKSYHPEHGVKDQGVQPQSEATFYVSSADAMKLGEIQALGGPARILAQPTSVTGHWGVKYLEGPSAGKFERRTVVKVETEPAVGLTPVEIFKGGARVHFGNEITSISATSPGVVAPTRMSELARGFRDLALSPVAAPINVWQAAAKWRPMYRRLEADPALDAFIRGGGNIAARSKVYAASDAPTIWRLWSRGQLAQTIKEDAAKAFTFPQTREILAENRAVRGQEVLDMSQDFGRLLAFPFREASQALTSVTAPVWDHGIPLLKAGAAIERMQTFIRQNPNASDAAASTRFRQIVTNIEDRMGEYNTANLFWHPLIKRITNQLMLSTSWTYGTIHATLTGLGWNPGRGLEWNPVATTNLMGQLGTIAFANAAWTVLATGKLPDSTLDYLIPFANARGLVRILLPGEEKEYHDWAKVVAETYSMYQDVGPGAAAKQFLQGTAGYGVGKLAPIWQAAIDLMTETNRIGERLAFKAGGMGAWLEKVFLPIFALNWDKGEKIGLDPVSNLMGVRQAPGSSAIFNPWSAEWQTFLDKQRKLHDRWSKEAIGRENRENGIVKPPREYQGRQPRGGKGFSPSNEWGR
jgi:hypothetical protein